MALTEKQGLELALADVNDQIRIVERQIRAVESSTVSTSAEKATRLTALRAELAVLQGQQSRLIAALNRLNFNTSSAADTTANAQVARDDGANTNAAPVTQKETGADGRVVEKVSDSPTNADKPKTTATGDTDFGTNASVRTLAQTQYAVSNLPPAEIKLIRRSDGTYVTQDGTPVPGVEVNGVGSRGDDAAPTPRPTVVNRLEELYAGAQNAITSQDNILDKFASYTYNLSWYLLDHDTYNTLLSSDVKNFNNYYLLAQSGGAPITTRSPNQTVDPQQAAQTGAGRNPFFPLDYYLDNFEFDTAISGTPGSRGAAKLSTLSFTVTEPNGISLQSNLIRAVNNLYWNKGLATKGTTINYNEAHYCMVIRFYGYDSDGNLVMPIDRRSGISDRQAAIEKFIPFNITGIDFKVANKLVEYSIRGAPVEQLTAFSTDRGSIPQNFQFQGATVKDILVGTSKTLTRSDRLSSLIQQTTNEEQAATRRNLTQDASDNRFLRALPPPPKASAILYRVGNTEATGLCTALNLFFAEEARSRGGKADTYEIQFLDPILSNAVIVPPGTPVDKSFAGGNSQTSAAAGLDPNRQSMDTTIRVRSCTAGQQIVQFIDLVMRSSSYIYSQQKYQWVVPPNGQGFWKYTGKANQTFAWFDISCEAQVTGYDETTRSNVYRMIYKVAPYQTTLTSEYFDPGAFRGVHKVYNYWFTGQNTQVTQYEQSFNGLWSQTISSNGPTQAESIKNAVNSRVIWKKRFQPASNQSREGAEGNTYEAAANAADMLYTADLAKISLNLIGDPAWIPSPKTPQPGAFVVSPFFPDGTINYGAGVPYFEFAWNRPVDYNLDTGLMDPGQNNYFADRENGRAGIAQESVIYMATGVKSKFSRGKFTQELRGAWLFDGKNKTTSTAGVTADQLAADANADNESRSIAQGNSDDTTRTEAANGSDNRFAKQGIPASAGVLKTAQASILNQFPSSPTAQSSGNIITGDTVSAPQPAAPAPAPAAGLATVAAPLKLPSGRFGSGIDNPSLSVNSDPPQLIAKDA